MRSFFLPCGWWLMRIVVQFSRQGTPCWPWRFTTSLKTSRVETNCCIFFEVSLSPQPDTWRSPLCSTVCPSTWRSTRWRTLCPSHWHCESLPLWQRSATTAGGSWRVSSDVFSTRSCFSSPQWPAECFVRSRSSSTTRGADLPVFYSLVI